jgi:hypothetical protein
MQSSSTLKRKSWGFESTNFHLNQIQRFSNVQTIYLISSKKSEMMREPESVLNMVEQCILKLSLLSVLTLEVPLDITDIVALFHQSITGNLNLQSLKVPSTARCIDEAVGFKHEVTRAHYTVKWDAGRGQTLTWANLKYFKSIPWYHLGTMYIVVSTHHLETHLSRSLNKSS